jgi:CRISPR-associated protein Cmr3
MSGALLALLPRDGLSCKDGRGWYTSEVGRGHSHAWPLPTTVRGALRASWGHHLMDESGRLLEPQEWERDSAGLTLRRLLALRRPLGEPFHPRHRMWPAPADALLVREGTGLQVERLLPRPSPPGVSTLGLDDDEAREALWLPLRSSRGKPVSGPRFWTEADMLAWLRGQPLAPPAVEDPVRRTDLHLAIQPDTQAAQPSMLHSLEVLEMLDREAGQPHRAVEWALGLECALPREAPDFPRGPVGLGGRRRMAGVERLGPELFSAPDALPGETPGLRLVLATPAEFQRGWLPDGFSRAPEGPLYVGRLPRLEAEVVLRAALVPRPLDVSAWDTVRRAPRPTRRWVPAGAVYFFQKRDGSTFTAREVRALWLAAWGGGREEALGLVLPGSWEPSGEKGT